MNDVTDTLPVGPRIQGDGIVFRFRDPDRDLADVRLFQEIRRPRIGPDFTYDGSAGLWETRLPVPNADRLEYMIQVTHPDGGTEMITDPYNDKVAPGPFGDKSVFELPGYIPPAWMSKEASEAGSIDKLEVKSRPLRARLPVLLWSPPGSGPSDELPLLIAHDGPEYAELSMLTRFLDVMTNENRIPSMRAALVGPSDRDNSYSASAAYSRSLAHEIVPQLLAIAPTPHGRRMRMGMAASLGALAMLHAHRRSPATFGSLFLQSGSYFRQRWDKQESGFPRFRRISRFVGEVLTSEGWSHPITATLTCGTVEENLANNRATYAALERQGYETKLVANRDGHNWVAWRDTFDPHLVDLIAGMWG
ncbi:MAG: alpha/beta hydrolase [Actinomycetota bacterium]